MSRHWLSSTTALALVLNAAAPLPSAAYDAANLVRGTARADTLLRVAENEASTAAQDLTSGILSTEDPASTSNEQGGETSVEAQAAAQAEAAAVAEAEAAKMQAEAEAAAAQAEADAAEIQAEADAAAAEANAAAETEAAADAEAVQAQADADAAADAATADAAQKEADAAAAAQADAEAEKAAADQAAAQAKADAEGAAAAQAEADAKAQAEADAAATAAADADAAAKAEADAAAKAEADAVAAAATEAAPAQSSEKAAADVLGEVPVSESTENSAPDVLPEISAETQANATAQADENAPVAAAASGEGEVVDSQEGTITEDQARSSSEEFQTTASGQPAPTAAPAAAAAPAAKKKDNDLLKTVGIVAAAGLGAYAVGQLLKGGGEVVSNTGDRAVVREPSGEYRIIKDDDTLLRRPGSAVQTQTYSDGSTRSEVTEVDGSSTVTIRAADGRVLRRTRVLNDGESYTLFDDTKTYERVDVSELEGANQFAATRDYDYSTADADQLRLALNSANGNLPDRTYSLNQIRRIDAVRHLVPVIALDAINFKTGSAVIGADEAQDLSDLGRAMTASIKDDPRQVFLIEGHTDTVGDASYNLALSDRRAESVALALTEYFQVPPSNMIVQGYGEADLRDRRAGDIRANRRGAVRNITPLLNGGR